MGNEEREEIKVEVAILKTEVESVKDRLGTVEKKVDRLMVWVAASAAVAAGGGGIVGSLLGG